METNKELQENRINTFIHYLDSFYGKKESIYGKSIFNNMIDFNIIKIYVERYVEFCNIINKTLYFDSSDRELIRDIILHYEKHIPLCKLEHDELTVYDIDKKYNISYSVGDFWKDDPTKIKWYKRNNWFGKGNKKSEVVYLINKKQYVFSYTDFYKSLGYDKLPIETDEIYEIQEKWNKYLTNNLESINDINKIK